MVKIITKASKVSKRNMNKSLNIVKKFMKMLSIKLTDREKSIEENGFLIEYFLLFGAIFNCGRIICWFFDKWVEFCEKLLGANFMVFGRSSFTLFLFVK